MMKAAILSRAAVAGVCMALCSCASVSVREIIPLTQAPTKVPQAILVQTFEFEDDMVRAGRQGEELEEFKRSMQQEMTANLLERLRKYIGPAQATSPESMLPRENSWVISGRFTRLYQGSRFLRGALGFGTGGTKMDVTATISDLSGKVPRRFLLIQTTGGTNAMPGAVMGVVTWPMILSGAPGLVSGLSGDSRRTAREITSALALYMKNHGLDAGKEAPKVKRKGSLPVFSNNREAEY
ncbi:MAG TPA: DUF4410 domain-containing protein [Terrimicrobiaceae bacterium]